MKNKPTSITLCNILCAALMLALLVCQFLPFWSAGENSASIQEYIWLPTQHQEITQMFQNTISSDFRIEEILLMPLVTLVSAVLGVVFCIIKPRSSWPCIFPLCCGIIGIFGYLSHPAMQMGALWPVHLVLCIAVLAAAIIPAIQFSKDIFYAFVPRKAEENVM